MPPGYRSIGCRSALVGACAMCASSATSASLFSPFACLARRVLWFPRELLTTASPSVMRSCGDRELVVVAGSSATTPKKNLDGSLLPGTELPGESAIALALAGLTLSLQFLARWPVLPQTWHFLWSFGILGLGQF